MKNWNPMVLLFTAAMLLWMALNATTSGKAQIPGTGVRIVGLGSQAPLPLRSDGTPYLPVRSDDRQLTFLSETWQNTGDILSLVPDGYPLPKQIVVCGHRLSMIQGALRTSLTDESFYFALTVNGTTLNVPNDGCFSITPVAHLRIKNITAIPRSQLPSVTIVASY